MHPNPVFRQEPRDLVLEFARERGFGTLITTGSEGVLAAHVPFVLEEGRVAGHLVRTNPLAKHLHAGPAAALLIVSGPDGYVSPDWYEEPRNRKVPTWNYVAVHLRGELRLIDQAALRSHLDRLAANFEERLAPKPAWATNKVDPGVLAGLMRQIVPVEMSVDTVDGTFKLSQNRSAADGAGAAAALAGGGTPGMETRALAVLMQEIRKETVAE